MRKNVPTHAPPQKILLQSVQVSSSPQRKKTQRKAYCPRERYNLAQHRHFRGRCYICGRKYKDCGYFVFHHLWYEENEKIYSEFRNANDYSQYVFTQIRKTPARFLLLCRGHHKAVETLAKYGDPTRKRLYHAVHATVDGHLKMARRKS